MNNLHLTTCMGEWQLQEILFLFAMDSDDDDKIVVFGVSPMLIIYKHANCLHLHWSIIFT